MPPTPESHKSAKSSPKIMFVFLTAIVFTLILFFGPQPTRATESATSPEAAQTFSYFFPVFNQSYPPELIESADCSAAPFTPREGSITLDCSGLQALQGSAPQAVSFIYSRWFPALGGPAVPIRGSAVLAFDLTLYGAALQVSTAASVSATLRYDAAFLPQDIDEETLQIQFLDEAQSTWKVLPEAQILGRDTTANTITIQITDFTAYALMPPTAAGGANQVYLPLVMKAGGTAAQLAPAGQEIMPNNPGYGYYSAIQVQPAGSYSTTVQTSFYHASGERRAVQETWLPMGGNKSIAYEMPADSAFQGSAIASADREIAAVARVADFRTGTLKSAAYTPAPAADQVKVPVVMNGYKGYATAITIQNPNNDTVQTHIDYNTGTGSCVDTFNIPKFASVTINHAYTPPDCLAQGAIGSATVLTFEADKVLNVLVTLSNGDNLATTNGVPIGGAGKQVVLPSVIQNVNTTQTDIFVSNLSAQDATITVSYTPGIGGQGTACSTTTSVPMYGVVDLNAKYFISQHPDCSGAQGWVGSASIESSQDIAAVALVNSPFAASATAYTGINPGSATQTVQMPLIQQNHVGWYTAFSVVNVGTTPTTVNCTFLDASTTTHTVDPQQSFIEVPGDPAGVDLGDNYSGSCTCTADQPLVAVVSLTKPAGVVSGGDWAMSYNGVPAP